MFERISHYTVNKDGCEVIRYFRGSNVWSNTIYSGRHIFTKFSYCYANIFNRKLFMLRIPHALCEIICNFFRNVLLEGIKRRSAPCHSIGIMISQELGAQARINFPPLSQFYFIPEWWHFPLFKISINRIKTIVNDILHFPPGYLPE